MCVFVWRKWREHGWCSVNQSRRMRRTLYTQQLLDTHDIHLPFVQLFCLWNLLSLSQPIELCFMLQFARNKSSQTFLKNALSEAKPKNSQEHSLLILGWNNLTCFWRFVDSMQRRHTVDINKNGYATTY